jgi:hypothetical protein
LAKVQGLVQVKLRGWAVVEESGLVRERGSLWALAREKVVGLAEDMGLARV